VRHERRRLELARERSGALEALRGLVAAAGQGGELTAQQIERPRTTEGPSPVR
jgi:hypothetical protein